MGIGISRCRKPATPLRRQEVRTVADVVMEIANSASIEKALRRDRSNLENTINILLLGGSDAGKSTILKQMRILHMNGFSDDEMYSFHKYLRRNLYQIFHEIAVELRENSEAIADSEKKMIKQFSEDIAWFVGMEESQEVEWLIDFRKINCKSCRKCVVYDIRIPHLNEQGQFMTADPKSHLRYFDNTIHYTSVGVKLIEPVFSELSKQFDRLLNATFPENLFELKH